jgi:hypothetical protein
VEALIITIERTGKAIVLARRAFHTNNDKIEAIEISSPLKEGK